MMLHHPNVQHQGNAEHFNLLEQATSHQHQGYYHHNRNMHDWESAQFYHSELRYPHQQQTVGHPNDFRHHRGESNRGKDVASHRETER